MSESRTAKHRARAMRGYVAALGLLAGCSHAAAPPSELGFYRNVDGPAVFYVQPAAKSVCIVGSPAMMDAYGGFKQVHIVGPEVDIQAAGKGTGTCRWPPGYYRNADSHVVYDVREGDVCRASDQRATSNGKGPGKRARSIRVVPPDSNVLTGLKFAGNCP